MSTVSDVFTAIATYVPVAISAAAAAAAVLPKGKDGSVWSAIVTAINFLALNFGKAKNAA